MALFWIVTVYVLQNLLFFLGLLSDYQTYLKLAIRSPSLNVTPRGIFSSNIYAKKDLRIYVVKIQKNGKKMRVFISQILFCKVMDFQILFQDWAQSF